eukprot:TRINITY_DN3125_c0_g1_i2.p1 TRINITY_DN3125_c0_g1~~TRINITY_DN3125_c0_g1_i2.p1  ORF type:complete len:279 (+),score=41.67 TRINITY_DN3125_c0_g1_i2:59-895(+)
MPRTQQRKLENLAGKLGKCRRENTFLDGEDEDVKAVESLEDVDRVLKHLADGDVERVGYKVGLNLPEGAFRGVGLAEPFTAPILKGWVVGDGAEVSGLYATRPGIAEAEWGFIIGKDLPSSTSPMDLDQVAAATSHLCLCIEIAASCMQGPSLTLLQKLSDHGLCTSVVVRPLCPTAPLLETETGLEVLAEQDVSLSVNGKRVVGPAAANPLKELHRLIRLTHSKGQGLQKGDLVITGAVVKHVGLKPNDQVVASFQHPTGDELVHVKCSIGAQEPTN